MMKKMLSKVVLVVCSLARSADSFSIAGIPVRIETGLFSSVVSVPVEQKIWKDDVPTVQVVDKMPDNLPRDMKNKYYLLRHGQSTANVAEIISSARSLAYSDKHGLTATGYEQGFASATQLLDMIDSEKGDRVVFVSSPLARARQTAAACLDGLNAQTSEWKEDLSVSQDIYYHDLLMERYFGRLDGEAIYTYAYVWPLDRINVTHTAFDVESVAAVCTRMHRLFADLEAFDFSASFDEDDSFEGTTHVVCTSHADVLQIAQLYAAEAPNVGEFSSYRFANGEVRRVQPGGGPDCLPEANPLQAPKRGTGM